MSMTTELAMEKMEEIRLRYSPKPIPKCRICGAEMSIGAVSASRTVYACSGATHDKNGWHYAPGRSLADDHYSESRVTVVDVSDPDVLALVEALEARDKQIAKDIQIKARLCRESKSLHDRLREAENRIAELEFAQSLHEEGTGMLCGQFDELAAAMGWTSELAEKQGVSQLEYARGLKLRIAELEARTVKLPLPRRKNADDYVDDTFEPCDLAAIYNACRLECEVKFKKALDAAGVAVEGE